MALHLLCVGGEDHALRIPFLAALQNRGLRVSAAGTGAASAFAKTGIPYHQYQFDRFGVGFADRAAMGQLTRLVKSARPDVIQTFDTKPNLFAPLALRGSVPVVRTINGMGWVFSSTELRALAFRPVYLAMQRLAACWTAATVFQNKADSSFFKRHRLLGKSSSVIIGSSGIDVGAFEAAQARTASPAALRAELGLGDAEIVLTVSRLTVQKGITTLLEAAKLVHEVRPNVRFLLVGPRESEGPFAVGQELIEAHAPYVIATGARSDIPALLGIADLFAFPTEYREGIPRVLLEAGLAGVPIVASRMPGCDDVVREDWNGKLVAPRDPRALAASILDLLQDSARAKTMGQRSINVVRKEFDLNVVADRYAELYTQLLPRSYSSGWRPAAHSSSEIQ
ncbi:glycosyltransferase involved in cell wall biosynthesis [Bradyrhizobium sp. JR7.2]|uniref:Glycosyltransferase n=2 Tax=Bradyrhizobium TaxID=374 RepID=A0ABY3QUZ1_9BRAD|nr:MULTISPECIES: glycosyltransferase [Bradyrhizobium]UFW89808.1 glycosyltransferase [Bradyrhizobium japonicum]WFT98569.1 glycosyltransferase [Bradyrhizobium barranii]CUU19964.1 probable sugar transferase CDS [Bradyrhizobium sp.]